ncbi:BQ5605_C018g08596 [Microbotryum silenes-dioicae]|uniref:BQ5605_C018g08596 protein n=1 Tax=Microbotryum silenes-dioicae TaxID=796604 RepID=A0A2X0P094_9BASI|nr:BQ5605_C018g08596 [Microbotryum silenes-dioicae]
MCKRAVTQPYTPHFAALCPGAETSLFSLVTLLCDPNGVPSLAGTVARSTSRVPVSHLSSRTHLSPPTSPAFFDLSFSLELDPQPSPHRRFFLDWCRSTYLDRSYMRSPTGAAPLAKGLACARCKSRKTRCDGKKPACSACLRSARFKHRPLDQVICRYSDPLDDTKPSIALSPQSVPTLNSEDRTSSSVSVVSPSSISSSSASTSSSFASSKDIAAAAAAAAAAPAIASPLPHLPHFHLIADRESDAFLSAAPKTRSVDEAYCETITGIAVLPLCWRLLLARDANNTVWSTTECAVQHPDPDGSQIRSCHSSLCATDTGSL